MALLAEGMESMLKGAWPGETLLLPLLSWCRGCPSYDAWFADAVCLDVPAAVVARLSVHSEKSVLVGPVPV